MVIESRNNMWNRTKQIRDLINRRVFRSQGEPREEVATVDRTAANNRDIGGEEDVGAIGNRPIYKRPEPSAKNAAPIKVII